MFVLPAVSVNAPLAIDNAPDPPLTPVVGVKTNVYCVDDTAANVPSVPPVTVTSLKTKVEDASDNCTVMVAVSPIFMVDRDELSVTVGFT